MQVWASPFSLFCPFVSSFNKPTNDKHAEQTVNGLRKIAWVSVSILRLNRQHIYMDIVPFSVYI
jgi:hypothetical protein